MASKNTVSVVGLNETVRGLKKLGVEVSDLKDAFTRIGAKATAAVKAASPVQSGRLQSTVKSSKRQNSVYIRSGSAKAYYAPFVEFGTRLQPAQGFMRKTAAKEGPDALKELEKEVNDIIKKYGLEG